MLLTNSLVGFFLSHNIFSLFCLPSTRPFDFGRFEWWLIERDLGSCLLLAFGRLPIQSVGPFIVDFLALCWTLCASVVGQKIPLPTHRTLNRFLSIVASDARYLLCWNADQNLPPGRLKVFLSSQKYIYST